MDHYEGHVMRGVLYLVVGLLLGANCVLAFAAIEPDDIVVRRTGGGISVIKPYNPAWSGGAGGAATSTATGVMDIAGRGVGVATSKTIPGTALATIGRGVARSMGPIGIGLSLAPLVWDELQAQWEVANGDLETSNTGVWYVYTGRTGVDTARAPSNLLYTSQVVTGASFRAASMSELGTDALGALVVPTGQVSHFGEQVRLANPRADGCLSGPVRCLFSVDVLRVSNGSKVETAQVYLNFTQRTPDACAAGLARSKTSGLCVPDAVPATDAQIEAEILEEISSSPYSAKTLAEYLELAGKSSEMQAQMGPGVASGPASVPGPTTTTTASGPAGQTMTVTNVTNNLTYNNNTVTVTTTTTSVTTHPDNSTSSETTTQEPPPADGVVAEVPPTEEQPSLCEEFPQASGCQPLGEVADQQIGQAERSIPGLAAGSVGGACPAPLVFSPGIGGTYLLEWDPVCDAAGTFRPAVIGMAWLGAGIWLFMIARGAA